MTKLMQLHLLYGKCRPTTIGYARVDKISMCDCGRFFIGGTVAISTSATIKSNNKARIDSIVASNPVWAAQWRSYRAMVTKVIRNRGSSTPGKAVGDYFDSFRQEAKTNGS